MAAAGWFAAAGAPAAEPLALSHARASFQAGTTNDLACVADGVEAGPRGWSVAPRIGEPQALVVRCAQPVEAAELDVTLFFLSGRPNNAIAEFALAYTTDAEPSLQGHWQPLDIQRFTAEVATLQRTEGGHLRAAVMPDEITGIVPDDTYRIGVLLPGGRASGFRLQVFPVFAFEGAQPWMSWGSPHDFVLTELRVQVRARESTNVALHSRVRASHPLCGLQVPGALVDGLPATIAHPADDRVGPEFHFDIDLSRSVAIDHVGLRTRGDGYLDRFTRLLVRLYADDPAQGAAPVWEGLDRADGSHPDAGTADIVRAPLGKGVFRGRYLRLSSDSPVPSSPQLAEVEVYETRTPEVVAALADGRSLPVANGLDLPPGVRRLSLQVRIPQLGLPAGAAFRWRVRGDLEEWQASRLMTVDLPAPRPGRTCFEAQALHSDHEWDASVYRLPILARQHFWQTGLFRGGVGAGTLLLVTGLIRTLTRRRAARQLAVLRAQTALAEERTRIARDLHDDLGAGLTHMALLSELTQADAHDPQAARRHAEEIFDTARKLARAVDEIVWAANPANDTVEKFAAFVGQFVQDFLRAAGVACTLDLPSELPARGMAAAVRHNLFLVVKEALHNVVAHAACRRVHFALALNGDRLSVSIRDDGRGFEAQRVEGRPGGGNGLANMRRRMADCGGALGLHSAPGQGTAVVLEVGVTP